ncbi:MAG: hypothetical protein RL609_1032 [Bacteroidota bacterium]|jgi:cytochrome c oxidase cbb3-type subunit 3
MKKAYILLIGLISSSSMWAGDHVNTAQANDSAYQDPLFYFLAFVAVLLLFFVWQFQKVFAALSIERIRKMKEEKRNQIHQHGGWLLLLFGMTDYGTVLSDVLHEGLGNTPMNALAFIIFVEVFVVLYYAQQIRKLTEKDEEYPAVEPEVELAKGENKFWNWFNNSVEIKEEASILTDHDYDGIQELDNSLPPWWKYGFYLTIVFAVIYLGYYHGAGGPSSAKEYQNQMDIAAAQIAAYQATQKDAVNENTFDFSDNANDIQAGAATFQSLCVACHGAMGEGKVGPNLTDAYWKNGGGSKDIFKTIKYGIKGTGMKSWKTDLSAAQIAQLASFVHSLQGSNPAGAKEPEGTLYEASNSDSISTEKPDSLLTAQQK